MRPKKKQLKRSKKAGLPPGSLIYLGPAHEQLPVANHICFNSDELNETPISEGFDTLNSTLKSNCVNWITVHGIHDPELIQNIGSGFQLDNLILEDILNTDHRPKFEEGDNSLFFTFKFISLEKDNLEVSSEQISLVLGHQFVLSFVENHSTIFEPIFERIRLQKGKIRRKGNDYTMYALMDVVVDNYFSVIEDLSQSLEDLEDNATVGKDKDTLLLIQQHKRALLTLRRIVHPLREQMAALLRSESDLISSNNLKYYRDIYDHLFHMVDSIENLMEINSSIKDLHLSNMSYKMNQVMQVLTVFTAIFTPLTFLAGVYGMNFEYMPELKWRYGYFAVWGLWVFIVLGLMYFFKRKKWF